MDIYSTSYSGPEPHLAQGCQEVSLEEMSGYGQYPTKIGEGAGKTADMSMSGFPLKVSGIGIVTKRDRTFMGLVQL